MKPLNYLGYFTEDESTAVHEAGHAVAAIRAGWPFSHIELTDWDDDEKWSRQQGAFVWHPDREIAWEMRQPLYAGINAGDKVIRRSVVIYALAGAVAERLLCEGHVLKPFPSAPDVSILEETGHYSPGTRGHLYSWTRYVLQEADPDLESRLDSIFAADLPMVETFVIDNQRAIGDVAVELWHSENLTLAYDEIRSAVEAADRRAA